MISNFQQPIRTNPRITVRPTTYKPEKFVSPPRIVGSGVRQEPNLHQMYNDGQMKPSMEGLDGVDLEFLVNCVEKKFGWAPLYSKHAVEEYRRFLYLKHAFGRTHGFHIIPPSVIGGIWREHMLHKTSYDDMCNALGQPIVYDEENDIHTPAEATKLQNVKNLYAAVFQNSPPHDVWGVDISDSENHRISKTLLQPSLGHGKDITASTKKETTETGDYTESSDSSDWGLQYETLRTLNTTTSSRSHSRPTTKFRSKTVTGARYNSSNFTTPSSFNRSSKLSSTKLSSTKPTSRDYSSTKLSSRDYSSTKLSSTKPTSRDYSSSRKQSSSRLSSSKATFNSYTGDLEYRKSSEMNLYKTYEPPSSSKGKKISKTSDMRNSKGISNFLSGFTSTNFPTIPKIEKVTNLSLHNHKHVHLN